MYELTLLLHDIRSAHNVGSLLRSAECFGVKEVFVSGFTPYPRVPHDTRLPHIADKNTRDIQKTALGAEKTVTVTVVDNVHEFLKDYRKNHTVLALEQDTRSTPLKDAWLTGNSLLIVGREVEGLDHSIRDLCDHIFEIPMLGSKESLNVAIATSIALYQLT